MLVIVGWLQGRQREDGNRLRSKRVEPSAGVTRPARCNDDPSRAPALGSFPFQEPGEQTELNFIRLSDFQQTSCHGCSFLRSSPWHPH